MALTATVKKLLNNLNLGTQKAKLGDTLDTALNAAGVAPAVATTAAAGIVKMATAQVDSAAAPTQAEFNALLAKLRVAGLMAP